MRISLIAAVGRNFEIGKDNDLMWKLPNDMKFFKNTTVGHPVIMGRRNWESIPPKFRPFADRLNIILSRNEALEAPGAAVVDTIEDALQLAEQTHTDLVYVIGGAQIYQLFLERGLADELLLTHVEGAFPGADAFFPSFDPAAYEATELQSHPADDKHAFAFRMVRYRKC